MSLNRAVYSNQMTQRWNVFNDIYNFCIMEIVIKNSQQNKIIIHRKNIIINI